MFNWRQLFRVIFGILDALLVAGVVYCLVCYIKITKAISSSSDTTTKNVSTVQGKGRKGRR